MGVKRQDTQGKFDLIPSPWVRTRAGGWVIDYSEAIRKTVSDRARKDMRQAAIKAVEALGLDFGAVDVGWNAQGPVVYEVNRAPGLDNATTERYGQRILEWANG